MPGGMRTTGVLDGGGSLQEMTAIPLTSVDKTDEREKASLHLTKKWKSIRGHLESRRMFYQKYLPPNIPLNMLDPSNAELWIVAQKTAFNMIQEIDTLIDMVDGTYERVRATHERRPD